MNTPCTQSGVCRGVVALLVVAPATACSRQQEEATTTAATPSAAEAPIPDTASPYDALPEGVRLVMDKPFTGDFDALVERRAIRVAVTFNRTHYFIDTGQERGLTFELLKLFENDLNADLKTGNLKVHVVIVPMSRDQLYPALASGKVDMVAAMVTVTPEREKLVAFSEPTRTNVSQVVVTGPGALPITTADDLAGQEVFVRKGSIYDESLVSLNAQLKARGKPPVVITVAPDVLEDDDVLEMVNAGLVPITVVDDYLAEFWSKVFTNIKVHQADKATRLSAYEPHWAENLLLSVRQALIEQPAGFYPYFDSVYSGGGFTLGAGYRRFTGDRTQWNVAGLYSGKGYKLIEAGATSPGHLSGHLDLHGTASCRDATQVAYHGLGIDSPADADTAFRMQQAYVGGDVTARPHRWLLLTTAASYEDYTLKNPTGTFTSVEDAFTPQAAPGAGVNPTYLHTTTSGAFDWRPAADYARRGGVYKIARHHYADRTARTASTGSMPKSCSTFPSCGRTG